MRRPSPARARYSRVTTATGQRSSTCTAPEAPLSGARQKNHSPVLAEGLGVHGGVDPHLPEVPAGQRTVNLGRLNSHRLTTPASQEWEAGRPMEGGSP